MRTSRKYAAIFALVAQTAVAAEARHVFWPWVVFRTNPPQPTSSGWATNLGFFNLGDAPGGIKVVRVYGKASVDPACVINGFTLQPGTGLDFAGRCGGLVDPVVYMELVADEGIVATAGVDRLYGENDYFATCVAEVSLGRANVPLYSDLFRAGARVVMGEIDLGQPEAPVCLGPRQYFRRVNLTMLNAGDAPARFRAAVLPAQSSREVLFETDYVVNPGEVFQANGLPIEVLSYPHSQFDYAIRVWLTVTADQPFLCYASSIFEPEQPDTMPFEVFPAQALP